MLERAEHVLCIPESAIEFSGDYTFVYVIKGEGENKTYERKPVVTGISDGLSIEIKKGITTSDKIRGPRIIATKEQ